MKSVLTFIYHLLLATNPAVIALLGMLASLAVIFQYASELWTALQTRIDAMAGPAFGGAMDFSPLGLIDYFIPLHETIALVAALFAWALVCASIRMIKSVIPTIS